MPVLASGIGQEYMVILKRGIDGKKNRLTGIRLKKSLAMSHSQTA